MSSENLHEPIDKIKPETINIHRAIVSLKEELEAIDWYRQRADACSDAQLRAILEHNMNEEIEHASMALEWIRRNVPKFNEALRTYLLTTENVVEIEKAADAGEKQDSTTADERPKTRATIGDMKGS